MNGNDGVLCRHSPRRPSRWRFVYGIYHGLTAKQIIGVASGTPGGGFHELGEKLLQVLTTDLDEQRLEAPVAFQKVESRGPRQNLQHLADYGFLKLARLRKLRS